jgi:hypothetical protein
MTTDQGLKALKEKLSARFLQQEPNSGVVGVGVGLDDQGRPVVEVRLDGLRPDVRARVLQHAGGHPVRFIDEGGPITKLSGRQESPGNG